MEKIFPIYIDTYFTFPKGYLFNISQSTAYTLITIPFTENYKLKTSKPVTLGP